MSSITNSTTQSSVSANNLYAGQNTTVAVVAGQDTNIEANNLIANNGANIAIVAGASQDTVNQIATPVLDSVISAHPPSPSITKYQIEKRTEGSLFHTFNLFIKNISASADSHLTISPTINLAVPQPLLSLNLKIEKLKIIALKDYDILEELARYISLQGSQCIFNPKEKSFDLDQIVTNFLNGNNKVFLLLGQSGGGKSTYLRYLENCLWKKWKVGKPIPILVKLININAPINQMVKEALREKDFNETEQEELKNRHSFIFLFDGYDELKSMKNLYYENKLSQWKAKTIITCRTEYLYGEQSNYRNYFIPLQGNSSSNVSLEEAEISPFTPEQIKTYCLQLIEIQSIPIKRTWEQYMADIDSIPSLKEMIVNPFFLSVIFPVLPSIIEDHRQSKSQKLLSVEILDKYVSYLFDKEEKRLIQRGNDLGISNLKQQFTSFAKGLASEMVKQKIISIKYIESSSFDDQLPSPWEKYFGSDLKKILIRSGVPLRKTGAHTYEFLHVTLLEYFSTRAFIGESDSKHEIENEDTLNEFSISSEKLNTIPQTKSDDLNKTKGSRISFDQLNQRLLTDSPGIIHFMAERVMSDSTLVDDLLSFIKRSKNNPSASNAAANAITILNSAKINLSQNDFQGIQIPGAILSGAILTNTNLSYADLTNVQLNEAILDYSTIAFSKTKGLELGQQPFFNLEGKEIVREIYPSHDGKLVLLEGTAENELFLKDYLTGNRLISFKMEQGYNQIKMTTLSQDGSRLMCTYEKHGSKSAVVWDCKTGNKLFSFRGHEFDVNSMALSADGQWAITKCDFDRPHLWNCQDGKEHKCFENFVFPVSSMALSKDGKYALLGSSVTLDTVHLWDLSIKKELFCFKEHTSTIVCTSFSSNSEIALSGSKDKTICLWDCQKGKKLQCFLGHTDTVTSVTFSLDTKMSLSGSLDGTVRLWDNYTGKQLQCFFGHTKAIIQVAFSHDSKFAYSLSKDQTLRVWNVSRIAEIRTNNMQFPKSYLMHASSDGTKALILEEDLIVSLWDCQTGKKTNFFSLQKEGINCMALSSDGKLAASISRDAIIRIWNCASGNELRSFVSYGYQINNVIFSPDDEFVLYGGVGGIHVHKWNCPENENNYRRLEYQDVSISKFFFSSNKRHIIVGTLNQVVYIYDYLNGNIVHGFSTHPQMATRVALSSNGELAISGNNDVTNSRADSTICIWDCKTEKKRHSFKGHEGKIIYVGLSPEGKWAVSAGDDKKVRIWDCEKGTELYCLHFEYQINQIELMPDGKELLISNQQPNFQLWQLVNNKGQIQPYLKWTNGDGALSAQLLNIEGITDLSKPNRILLEQHGAKQIS